MSLLKDFLGYYDIKFTKAFKILRPNSLIDVKSEIEDVGGIFNPNPSRSPKTKPKPKLSMNTGQSKKGGNIKNNFVKTLVPSQNICKHKRSRNVRSSFTQHGTHDFTTFVGNGEGLKNGRYRRYQDFVANKTKDIDYQTKVFAKSHNSKIGKCNHEV